MDPGLLLVGIDLAEGDPPHETKVTLVIEGIVISGFITSKNQYLLHLANAKNLENPQENEDSAEHPTFIHLRDASYYQPGQKPVDNIGSYTQLTNSSLNI